jgi:hypothetical protein
LFAVDIARGILYRSVQPVVSVNQIDDESKIEIYPNPCKNSIFFDLTGTHLKNAVLHVYNSKGQSVFNKDLLINSCSRFAINTTDWSPGTYYYTLDNEYNVYSGKIIKTE